MADCTIESGRRGEVKRRGKKPSLESLLQKGLPSLGVSTSPEVTAARFKVQALVEVEQRVMALLREARAAAMAELQNSMEKVQ